MNRNSRILYIGDVPIEATTGGEMLLYKLLKDHSADKLMVIQTRNEKVVYSITKNAGLPGVGYFNIKYLRLYGSRFAMMDHLNHWINYLYLFTWFFRIRKISRKFKPDVVLTVAHHLLWPTALRISDSLKIPIYVIIHDDWEGTVNGAFLRRYLEKKFMQLFQVAERRFSVSPFMTSAYKERYGQDSDVLYPMAFEERRLVSDEIPATRSESGPFTIGYAGSLWNRYPESFVLMCHAMNTLQGKVVAYTNRDLAFLKERGLRSDNIELHEFIPVQDLLIALKAECDVLYLPMDFERKFEENMKVAFPSKIAEYSLLGLPMLIHAPEYSSIVRWARRLEPLKFAEIVTSMEVDDLKSALIRLKDSNYREELKEGAVRISKTYFDPAAVRDVFYG